MRAAIYTRLSYDRHGDELGVTRQEEDCRAIIERRGWTLTSVYRDNSLSAFKDSVRRPEYEQLRADYAAGKFEALVCFDLDRLTRQPRQLEDWIDAAEKHGLALVTANGEADLTTVNGRTFARTKAAFSRGEVEMKSMRQRRAAKQRAEQGKPWGPWRPFGFADDQVTHDPVEAEAVRRLYEDFLAGVPQHSLARKLNDQGVTTPRGNDWTQAGIRRLLRSPRNAGLAQHKGKLTGTAAEWGPIVSRETYDAAVSLMDHRRGTVAPGHNAMRHLLTGIARCGVCGRGVRVKWRAGGARAYQCPDSHVGRAADPIDEMVTAYVLGYVQQFGLAADSSSHDVPDRAELIAEAETLRKRREQLGAEFADGELDPSTLRAASRRLDERLEQINQELMTASTTPGLQALTEADDIRAAWESLDLHRKRGVIESVAGVEILPSSVPGSKRFRPEDVRITPSQG